MFSQLITSRKPIYWILVTAISLQGIVGLLDQLHAYSTWKTHGHYALFMESVVASPPALIWPVLCALFGLLGVEATLHNGAIKQVLPRVPTRTLYCHLWLSGAIRVCIATVIPLLVSALTVSLLIIKYGEQDERFIAEGRFLGSLMEVSPNLYYAAFTSWWILISLTYYTASFCLRLTTSQKILAYFCPFLVHIGVSIILIGLNMPQFSPFVSLLPFMVQITHDVYVTVGLIPTVVLIIATFIYSVIRRVLDQHYAHEIYIY